MLTRGDTLVLASNNKGKLAEMRAVLAPLGLNLVPIGDYTSDEPVEDGTTFLANALIKARAASAICKLPVLADDSGLSIPALDGRPGVDSKPFMESCGTYDAATKQLLDEVGMLQTPAAFICCLVLALPDGTEQVIEGNCTGTLTYPGQGTEGFGFDPYFIPTGYTESFSVLGMEIKNKLSHRADALQKLLKLLQTQSNAA